jgi:hypothetical protein
MALSGARRPLSHAPSLARQALSSVEIGPLYRRQMKAVRLWRFRRLSLPFVDWGRAFEAANCSALAAAPWPTAIVKARSGHCCYCLLGQIMSARVY